jgi:flavin-dependent dehydrogenase
MAESTDVFVIGGGPAGLAAAIAARQKGFRVTVADGAKPPIEKACGEGLMPDTIATLRELGIFLGGEDGLAFRGIRFIEGSAAVEGKFPFESGIGLRRRVLHQKMIDRAARCGVAMLWGTPVMGIGDNAVILASGDRISAKWIVGADGAGSRVRKWGGLEAFSRFESRFAYRRHYRIKPWSDCVEVYWGENSQAYVTPVSPDQICFTVMSRNPDARLEESLPKCPGLRARLANAYPASVERGGVTSMHRLRRVFSKNVALVGDASGSVDAITGEGLSLAFRQAMALAEAFEAQDLRNYQRAHRRIARRPTFMAECMLLLGRNRSLRKRVVRTFAADPEIFSRLLSLHVGVSSPAHSVVTSAMLGWQMVTV